MRRPYLALVWPPNSPDAGARAAELGRRLATDGHWTCAGALPGVALWTSAPAPAVRPLLGSAGYLIGDYFSRPDEPASRLEDVSTSRGPEAVARRLTGSGWGGYVALLRGAGDEMPSVLRDPSGRVGALTWSLGLDLAVVAADIVPTPPWLRPKHLALNWDRIWRFLALPSAGMSDPLFDGVAAVGPGELAPAGNPDRARRLIWSPARFIASETDDLSEAARALVRRVDASTAALAGGHDKLIMEISGGLDSAIVAGAVGVTGLAPRVTQWLNRVGDRKEADESAYARAVTHRLRAELTVAPKRPDTLDQAALFELASGLWPTLAGLDRGRDLDVLGRLQATGATAILSGEGGDAVFFQMPTALVASDAFRRQGLSFLASPLLADVARRTRRSVWAVLGEVVADLRGHPRFPLVSSPYVAGLGPDSEARSEHPWVREAREAGAPSAKVLQVLALSAGQLFHADSRREAVGDMLYPLLAQPVVEFCLSIPASVLAGASYDRPFARAAFAARIPESVRLRRGKGDHSSIYARTVALSLDALRPHLLEGCLCEAGVIDRAVLEIALTPERLIWGEDPGAILWAAAVESWVRHWQGRVPDSDRAPRRAA